MRRKTAAHSSSRLAPYVLRLVFPRDGVTLPLVLLLTLIAGVLRFTALDKPSIWGDEAATYGRVCGSYQELLDQLTDSAFPPLHYVIEWWIGQGMPYWGTLAPDPLTPATTKPVFTPTKRIVEGGIPLTPFALRFVPALAGTLMIPAMYWLARQLFGPRVGLTAALLACFSAYLLVFSRDAKMYMPFWLMVTLHVGCALWWVRSRRGIAWTLWVLSGAAMIGFHASGFYVLAIDALIVFTSSRQYVGRTIATATGLIAWVSVGIVYLLYRAWREDGALSPVRPAQQPMGDTQTPVSEVRRRPGSPDADMSSPGLRPTSGTGVWGSLASGRFSLTLDSYRDRFFRVLLWPRRAWRRFRLAPLIAMLVGVVLMAAGPVGYYVGFSKKFEQISERRTGQTDTGDLGIDWVDRYNADRGLGGHLLYTASAYLTGWEWPRNYSELKDDPAALAARRQPFVPLDDQEHVRPRVLFLLQQATVILLGLLAIGLIPWRRAFSPVRARLDRIRQTGRVWPAARTRRVLWLAVWGLALPWAVYTQSFTRPVNPLDAAATVVLQSPPNVTWPRAKWYPKKVTPTEPTFRESAAEITDRMKRSWADATTGWPAAWEKYKSAFRSENVRPAAVYGIGLVAVGLLTFVVWKRRQVGRGALVLAGVTVVVLLLGSVMTLVPQFVDANVWMPRYLGAALPALIVGAAVLIDRQPRGLRWATIVVFLLANMGQFAGRVWAGSEPPTGLMAADVVAAQSKATVSWRPEKPAFRAFFLGGLPGNAEPGGGTLRNGPGRYYLRLFSGVPSPAQEIRGVRIPSSQEPTRPYYDRFDIPTPGSFQQIANEIKKSPQVRRFAVWQWQPVGGNGLTRADPVGDALKTTFRRINEETWTARDHWRWTERWEFRRREYERVVP